MAVEMAEMGGMTDIRQLPHLPERDDNALLDELPPFLARIIRDLQERVASLEARADGFRPQSG